MKSTAMYEAMYFLRFSDLLPKDRLRVRFLVYSKLSELFLSKHV